MKTRFIVLGLWLLGTVGGIAPAHALDLSVAEVLKYNVFWGPFRVGTAELSYVPQGAAFGKTGGYVVQARVQSDTSLMTMDDLWRAVGVHGRRAAFTPQRYEVAQIENDYTSNKAMVFNKKTVKYTNYKDKGDVEPALAWDGTMRDPLGTVYAWRQGGLEPLKKASEVRVVGLKRAFSLKRQPAEAETLMIRGKSVSVWKVDMISVAQRKGKEPHKSTWTVWLMDDGKLTPVQILAQTKFGTFRAQLN